MSLGLTVYAKQIKEELRDVVNWLSVHISKIIDRNVKINTAATFRCTLSLRIADRKNTPYCEGGFLFKGGVNKFCSVGTKLRLAVVFSLSRFSRSLFR